MITTATRIPLPVERHHPLVTRIRHLCMREERERTGFFYVEGMRFLTQAMQHQAHIETLVVCRDLLIHPYAQKLVRMHEQ